MRRREDAETTFGRLKAGDVFLAPSGALYMHVIDRGVNRAVHLGSFAVVDVDEDARVTPQPDAELVW